MSPESFGGKVVLSIIDKLVLGVAAALVVFQFQSSEQRRQKLADEMTAVARGYTTDLLIEERQHLTTAISSYFDLVDTIRASGHAAGEQARQLRELEVKVIGVGHRLDASMSERGDKAATVHVTNLLDAVQGFDVSLMGGTVPPLDTDKALGAIAKEYGDLLTSLRKLTIESLSQ